MAKYMYLFRGGADNRKALSQEDMQAHMSAWGAWIGELTQNGKFVDGLPLAGEGKRVSGGGEVVSDGPYAEGREVVGGYLIVEAASEDEAVDLSRKCPVFEHGGEVEVREILSMDM